MAGQFRLDRKTWIALAVAPLLLVAVSLFPVVKYVGSKLDERSPAVVSPTSDDVERLPDGSTILMEHDPVARHIVDWLNSGPSSEQAIFVRDSNFKAGSATITREGWGHLAQLARVVKASRDMKALILFAPHHDDPSTLKLERLRADQIHEELLRLGVREQQVAIGREMFQAGENPTEEKGLKIILVKRRATAGEPSARKVTR